MGALRFFDLDQIVVIGLSQGKIQVDRDLSASCASRADPLELKPRDEARRIAANIAKLPELLRKQ